MRSVLLVSLCLLATAIALPVASAGPEWLPVCKDKDVRTGYVNVHVGVDCYPGIWVDVCAPGEACQRYELALN
jgi:hypothetical protein